jgi:Endosomal/lysosomal potassium channel TMEM175
MNFYRSNSVPAADKFRWEDIDQRLLLPNISDLAEEMHKRIAEGERKVNSDTQKSGNSAGYLPRLFDFHERLVDEWAERLYAAHREAWIQQNRMEAFSDGVLAVIITIMVLEIKPPLGTGIMALHAKVMGPIQSDSS